MIWFATLLPIKSLIPINDRLQWKTRLANSLEDAVLEANKWFEHYEGSWIDPSSRFHICCFCFSWSLGCAIHAPTFTGCTARDKLLVFQKQQPQRLAVLPSTERSEMKGNDFSSFCTVIREEGHGFERRKPVDGHQVSLYSQLHWNSFPPPVCDSLTDGVSGGSKEEANTEPSSFSLSHRHTPRSLLFSLLNPPDYLSLLASHLHSLRQDCFWSFLPHFCIRIMTQRKLFRPWDSDNSSQSHPPNHFLQYSTTSAFSPVVRQTTHHLHNHTHHTLHHTPYCDHNSYNNILQMTTLASTLVAGQTSSTSSDRSSNNNNNNKPRRQRPKRFHCPHCHIAFSNQGQLRGHVRTHTGERPFVCDNPSCGKSFTRNEELTRHKR